LKRENVPVFEEEGKEQEQTVRYKKDASSGVVRL